jgi:hypothetical protein
MWMVVVGPSSPVFLGPVSFVSTAGRLVSSLALN